MSSVKSILAKKINFDPDSDSLEFEWESECSDDKKTLGGTGMKTLDFRPYLSEDDEDDSNDDEEVDDEYDERENWDITIGVIFTVNSSGILDSIEIHADVSCIGDSGLGECDPSEEWTSEDLQLATEFFDSITE